MLPKQFCWCLIGVPGSGKTTYIKNLVTDTHFYRDKFDYIISSSPSPLDISLIPEECQSQTFRLDWLYERINYLRSLRLRGKNLLFIFDDCISQLKKVSNDPMLVDLFFNRRHVIPGCTISIILTTQQFTMVPAKFRAVCEYYTFLSLTPRDSEFIKKELIHSHNRRCLSQIVSTFDQPHNFIFIRVQPFLLCQNFKPLLSGSTYVGVSDAISEIPKSFKQSAQMNSRDRSRSRSPLKEQSESKADQINSLDKLKLFSFKASHSKR